MSLRKSAFDVARNWLRPGELEGMGSVGGKYASVSFKATLNRRKVFLGIIMGESLTSVEPTIRAKSPVAAYRAGGTRWRNRKTLIVTVVNKKEKTFEGVFSIPSRVTRFQLLGYQNYS